MTDEHHESIDLIHKLTSGRLDAFSACLLSKAQSKWLSDVVYRESGVRINGRPVKIGEYELQTMSRFRRNNNTAVIKVRRILSLELQPLPIRTDIIALYQARACLAKLNDESARRIMIKVIETLESNLRRTCPEFEELIKQVE